MLGEELIRVHENAELVPRFSERYPHLTPESGYQASRALHEHRLAAGWRPLGRKVGFTNRTLWARYGVFEPIWGMVYDRTLIQSENHRALVSLAGLTQPRIEPEICFKLKATPRSSAPQDVIDSIEWMAHAVEIVQCHHPDWQITLADCTANNGLHGRLIVGTPAPLADAGKFPLVQAKLFEGERLVDQGVGANVLGSPLLALGHLVDVLKRQSGAPALRPGEIITTGVLTDAHPVAPGEIWRTEIAGMAVHGLTVSFVP